MTTDGDPRKDEPDDQSASDFGPPVGEFGPPVSEFGPPVSEFGPPMGDTGPRWQSPDQTADHPELVWRPAAEPESTPAPPAQYRAPDSTVFPEQPRPPAPPRVPSGDREQPPRPPADADQDSWWTQPTVTGSVPKPPPPTAPGLSWSDDPIAQRLALSVPTLQPARRSDSHRRRNWAAGLLAIAILIGLTVTVIVVSGNNGDTSGPPAANTTAALSCPATKDGKVTVGNGSGDSSTGAGAILGFQYAFYVERSGERARRFVAPDAENVSPAERIQKGIDEQVPVGTTHCLRITELATDTFDVDLTEHKPDGTTTVYPQTVTTVNRDGKALVYAIKDRR